MTTPTLTADAINTLYDTMRETQVELLGLPKESATDALLAPDPTVIVIRDGKGGVELKPIGPLLAPYLAKPLHRTGTAQATTLESFIALVNRHKSADTAIFVDANWRKPALTAIIDYHQSVAASMTSAPVGADPHARHGKHRIHYAFPLSESWQIWVAKSGKLMSQGDFACFLEDHIHEVAAPEQFEAVEMEHTFRCKVAGPVDLLELSRGLEITVGARIKSKVNLNSGEKQLVFETEHRDARGGEILVPGLFLVSVPPFYAGEAVRIPARLRYRPGAEGVQWSYDLIRPDQAIDARVRNDVETVAEVTDLPTYDGSPEA